jgi:hypothetical protein
MAGPTAVSEEGVPPPQPPSEAGVLADMRARLQQMERRARHQRQEQEREHERQQRGRQLGSLTPSSRASSVASEHEEELTRTRSRAEVVVGGVVSAVLGGGHAVEAAEAEGRRRAEAAQGAQAVQQAEAEAAWRVRGAAAEVTRQVLAVSDEGPAL